MQSMDEAGNISWSSLISVTSSFPAHGETTWDLFYFMGEGLKRNPPKQAQLPSVYTCPAFPIFSVNLTEIQLLPMAPALIKAPLLWHPHTGASWSSWQLTEHTQWVTVLMGEASWKILVKNENKKKVTSNHLLFSKRNWLFNAGSSAGSWLWAPAGLLNCTTLPSTAEGSGAEPIQWEDAQGTAKWQIFHLCGIYS